MNGPFVIFVAICVVAISYLILKPSGKMFWSRLWQSPERSRFDSPRTLFMVLRCGLGNRLFSYFYGLSIVKDCNFENVVFLTDSQNTNCIFWPWGGHHPGELTFSVPKMNNSITCAWEPLVMDMSIDQLRAENISLQGVKTSMELTTLTTEKNVYGITDNYFDPAFFHHNSEYVLERMRPRPQAIEYMKTNYPLFFADGEEILGIHLRLGHTGDHFIMEHPGIEDINRIYKQRSYTRAVIFTDNIVEAKEYCKNSDIPIEFVSDINYIELLLLSRCTTILCSISSFSFCAGYLSTTAKEIYFPKCGKLCLNPGQRGMFYSQLALNPIVWKEL